MSAYYNEIDPFAASWLRELIKAGLIAPGHVDERSIEDVRPGDLAGFKQCHFFAGIGVWSYALRCAGWPDDRPVWTGSCPCQPFSAAGKGGGFADERHLWPAFFWLIRQCHPVTVFGEQVASRDGLAWLDLVSSDLEEAGYACGAVDTCAAGIGAPHIRQRLYWVADTEGGGSRAGFCDYESGKERRSVIADGGAVRGMGNAISAGLEGHAGHGNGEAERQEAAGSVAEAGNSGVLENSCGHGRQAGQDNNRDDGRQPGATGERFEPGPTDGYWRNADWLFCRDGKWRPVEPGAYPLAHGAAARVGRLRGYGNAIVATAGARSGGMRENKAMRLGLYRKIEIARKQLSYMDEEAFRGLLRAEFGVESRKDMNIHQLSQLVQLFAAQYGVTYTAPAKSRNSRVTPHGRPDFIEITDSMPYAREKRQILAIWRKLGYSMTSLDTRVKRAFGTHCFVWLQNGEQISTLLSDLQRREKAFEKKRGTHAQRKAGGGLGE